MSKKSALGEIITASHVIDGGYTQQHSRRIMALLAFCVALLMTGFGIIMPVFARRLGEFGSGVEALGLMTMSFALAQFISAPIMGSLADRFGRRPLILTGLVAFALANIGFLLASTTTGFITVRTIEGALTAGIFPAAMGVVADIAPEENRARWAGILMGSYGAGFIFGPVLGGFLYDTFGFSMPFIASAVMAGSALVAAIIVLPETRTKAVRKREMLLKRTVPLTENGSKPSLLDTLPRPLLIFAILLLVDFVIVFTFALVEPEMVFYFYDNLGWTTIQFGLIVGIYGASMVAGQWFLGPLSDRYARKPVIIIGMALNSFFYIGLALVTNYYLLIIVAMISGIGEALMMPALSAFYMDISNRQYRSRVLGFKESAASLGGVAGPLIVALISGLVSSQVIFLIAFIVMALTTGLTIFILREPGRKYKETPDIIQSLSAQPSISPQAVYSGIVLVAITTRKSHTTS